MSSAIDPITARIDHPREHATPATTPSVTDMRGGIRRLRLHGATIHACRHCRTPIRAVSAAYLPEDCPACGHGTWTLHGSCSVTAACDGARPPGDRPHAHCHRCGESVWRRVAAIDPRGV